MKHTPGPWRYKEEPHHKWKTCKQFIIDSDDRGLMFLGEVYEDKNDPGQLDEVRANARLIVAAPDLLNALEGFVIAHRLNLWKTTNGTDAAVLDKLKQAIAKATKKDMN